MTVERETWLTTFAGQYKMFYCTRICKDKKADQKETSHNSNSLYLCQETNMEEQSAPYNIHQCIQQIMIKT
jgi:hypothetical protein